MSGEVVDSGKAHLLDLQKPVPHAPSGVRRVHPADDRGFFYHRQDFELPDLHGHCIGIAIGHQPTGRTMPRHAEAP